MKTLLWRQRERKKNQALLFSNDGSRESGENDICGKREIHWIWEKERERGIHWWDELETRLYEESPRRTNSYEPANETNRQNIAHFRQEQAGTMDTHLHLRSGKNNIEPQLWRGERERQQSTELKGERIPPSARWTETLRTMRSGDRGITEHFASTFHPQRGFFGLQFNSAEVGVVPNAVNPYGIRVDEIQREEKEQEIWEDYLIRFEKSVCGDEAEDQREFCQERGERERTKPGTSLFPLCRVYSPWQCKNSSSV